MGDYRLASPTGHAVLDLPYVGEPPHGDSYHQLLHNGRALPGWIWGDNAAFSEDGRYFVAAWMEQLFERATVVLDLDRHMYCRLPSYLSGAFQIQWPAIIGPQGRYVLTGKETWRPY